ncbi:carboxypeptidase N subunit 2-like [Mytilus trossulus]|uniref:carboxypeptidase N subunit 2-like n=1 Tax=Mytilus trossulus TaxID=6551 RepID=UPI003007D1CB
MDRRIRYSGGMSVLLWCKNITLLLLIGEGCSANTDCKTLSTCEMVCDTRGPLYRCNGSGLIEVPNFPESTLELDIRGNTLTNLLLNVFYSIVDIEQLDLSNNKLISVHDAIFSKNVALELLDLSNNHLTSVSVAFVSNNVALKHLSVSNNNLTRLPDDVFMNNVMLKSLELSNNKLSSIPDAVFSNNVKLQSLSLANNYLTSIPKDVFKNNVALVYVSLSNNNLTRVPDAVFMNNEALTHLVLSNNNITSVPDGVLENNRTLTNIYCKECFDCDCLYASTYQWITTIVKDLQAYELTCRNGEALPDTIVKCTDDGSHLAVDIIENETLCYCKNSTSMKESSMDSTTETTPPIESTIEKVQRNTKTDGKSH